MTDDDAPHRKPRAIRLDNVREPEAPAAESKDAGKTRAPRAIRDLPTLEPVPDEAANGLDALTPPPPPPPRGGFSWGVLFLSALGGLVSLAAGLAIDRLIRDLFERNTWLGWAGAVLAALVVLAALGFALREAFGLMRMRSIARLREEAAEAHRVDNAGKARAVVGELVSLYAARAETAHGRRELARHAAEVIDGADLIALAERDLLAPLDERATAMVMNSSKRVSIVTAVSPRALVDMAFVLMENLRLIRRIAELYGGRPGTLGFWRLARNVVAHLATTGAIAIGDGVVQQLVGHGLAAKLSARLGEGVVNGLLTARIGIAAIDVCRPMPFIVRKRPGIPDFLSELLRLDGLQKKAGSEILPDDPDRDPVSGRRIR